MSANNPNERLVKFLQATPEQQNMVDRILEGHPEAQAGKTTMPPSELLTKKELAARMKITVRCLENWMARGIVPFISVKKVRLFCWDDVVKHLKAHHQVCRRNVLP